MFEKILIANRGEIALRIHRAVGAGTHDAALVLDPSRAARASSDRDAAHGGAAPDGSAAHAIRAAVVPSAA